MTWSVAFRLRRYLRESLWVVPLVGGLLAATGLPLIVAIVGIGSKRGDISDGVGASLIGAGMVSVLVYPLVGIRLFRSPAPADEPLAAQREDEAY